MAGTALAAGTACGVSTALDARILTWLSLSALLAALLVRHLSSRRVALWAFLAWVAVAGAAWGARSRDEALNTSLRQALDGTYGQFVLESPGPEGRHEPLATRLRLDEDASPLGDVVLLRASVVAIRLHGVWQPLRGDGVRLTIAGASSQRLWAEWRAGRTIVAPVVFRRPSRYLNDGVPDLERALALDGITLLGSVKSGLLVHVEQHGSWIAEAAATARALVRRVVMQRMGARHPTAAGITTAVLIGDRTGLPDDVRIRLQQAGVYHVIAISGGNIAILAGIALTVLALCGIRGRAAAAVTLIVVIGYACIVTAGPSVWRATTMAALALAARTIELRTPARHTVAVAAMVMVIVWPLDVRDPGFLLTFGATIALVEMAHRMRRKPTLRLPEARDQGHRLVRVAGHVCRVWLLPSLAASTAVELALMPVSAETFSRVTVAGVVLNLIAVPLMALVQIAGLALVAVDRWTSVADTAALIGSWSADGILQSARLVELVPWLAWRVPPPGTILIAAYYAGLGAMISGRRRLHRGGGVLVAAAALAIVSGASAGVVRGGDDETSLRLTVFDVGQAESMLLETPGAGPIVVDAAGANYGSPGFAIGSRVLAPAIWRRGIRSIETLVVTHGDPDHIGGAEALLDDFAPARLWTGVDVPRHEPSRALSARARRTGVVLSSLRAGEVRTWGRATIRVLHPPPPDWERPRVRNDDSVVLEVLYGDTALLLTGDISREVELAILPRLSRTRHRVLKVAHHGSRTSTSRELLEAWAPELAIISCGRGNQFGHPAPEVIERLQSAGVRVLRTDRDGQITIETDGHSLSFHTFRDAATKPAKR